MAATPEEFLGQGAFLAVPEPFSPSVFLDLPPTPRPDVGGGGGGSGCDDPASSSDDLVLPFISRMLMEEDIDDTFFYQYPDHPALLTAQQPYAQILSAPSSSTSDSATTTTTLSSSGSSGATEPSWPYDPIELAQLLRSPPTPDMGLGLDDFIADDAGAVLLPAPDAVTTGFGQAPMAGALPSDGGGDRGQPSPFAGQSGGDAIQSSGSPGGADHEDAKTNIFTTLPAAGEDHHALASAFFGGHQGVNMDMLNRAFAKGMEEAKKFLPANNGLLIDLEATTGEHLPTDIKPFTLRHVKEEASDGMSMFRECGTGRGRKNRHHEDDLEAEIGRSRKLMMPEQEDKDAQEMYRDIMTFDVEAFMKRMQDLRIAKESESEKSSRKGTRGRQGANEVVDLRTMLIHCAQAVATGDLRTANEMLKQIKQHSSVTGDGTQRLARCFAEALEARLAGTESLVYKSLMSKQTSVVDYLKAYRLFMAASCFKKVKHIFSNRTIQDAVAGKSKLHIVDYGVQHGFQWPALLHYLANREGGPPEVRFTGIDLPQPGFRPAYQIEKTGERLSDCARQFRVPFKFHGIASKWETVTPEDLNIDPDEVLVVNCECYLDKLTDESVVVDSPCPRDMVLNNIRNMRPNVFIHCVVNGTFGAPFFLTRFREALFFYSAQFDMLDATIPRDNEVRLMIERDLLGRSALNVIACEGADRVERPETYKQWQVRNNRAGLRQLPLRAELVKLARDKVMDHYHKDFLLDVDQRWLLQGWKGRVLYAMSTWVAEDSNSIF